MSRKYKFHNEKGVYFVSFAVVYWMDVFTREAYFDEIVNSLKFCKVKKGLIIYSWCIMPNHVHLIFKAKENNPTDLLRSLKTYTSKRIQKSIENNLKESRKTWLLKMMEKSARKHSNGKSRQFWQHHNQPIELWSNEVIQQKVDYIHNNPVRAGFVTNPADWKYSSAKFYEDEESVLRITKV